VKKKSEMGVRREKSFGVVPLSFRNGVWEVFLIQHQKARYWGFPKGHAEPGESPRESAVRELKEETNLDVDRFLREEPFVEQYQFKIAGKPVSKQVSYYVAEVSGTVHLQEKEIQAGMWVPFEKAFEQVTHREGKAILRQVKDIL
jgi:8-oxo-dGTP pyrophosphatase MutT (NUDIX family)